MNDFGMTAAPAPALVAIENAVRQALATSGATPDAIENAVRRALAATPNAPAPIPISIEDGDAVQQFAARIGADPEQRKLRDGAAEFLSDMGFPTSPRTLAKRASVSMDGPRYIIFAGKAVYRVGDLLAWALARMQAPEDGPAARGARTRRARGDVFGRKGRPAQEAAAA